MGKTYKDRPDKYSEFSRKKSRKPKELRRFESSKGRKKDKLRDEVFSTTSLGKPF